MSSSTAVILGAGFSHVAGLPLANDLFNSDVLVTSKAAERRYTAVLDGWQTWKSTHRDQGPEQFLTDDHVAEYEAAVEAFIDGRWHEALDHFDRLPVGDRAKDFLMIYIAQNEYEPPDGWDGVIAMSSK